MPPVPWWLHGCPAPRARAWRTCSSAITRPPGSFRLPGQKLWGRELPIRYSPTGTVCRTGLPACPTSLVPAELRDAHGTVRKDRANFQLAAHGFDELRERADIHVRAPLHLGNVRSEEHTSELQSLRHL